MAIPKLFGLQSGGCRCSGWMALSSELCADFKPWPRTEVPEETTAESGRVKARGGAHPTVRLSSINVTYCSAETGFRIEIGKLLEKFLGQRRRPSGHSHFGQELGTGNTAPTAIPAPATGADGDSAVARLDRSRIPSASCKIDSTAACHFACTFQGDGDKYDGRGPQHRKR